ncbi:hypothetical protein CAPTEDRAFT_159950 [Capitella teleta]|uniref:Peptidase S1 domain-containing protein n=1 Tax=Capitella teleta TaxID=283909 RepID=R7T7Q5_CAPTE|nr:hypothetical protein CAPTEDRAFT_159950 [Capitella teleta]|eukprot:ELT89463.1 hypothetical protein CAPTEDRAFT_159950 [Capitella teleta]
MRVLVVVFMAVLAYGEAKRIIGGTNAATGEFPHQLSLRAPTSHNCGAVLIALNKAITAAHCITGTSYNIRAGTLTHATCSGNCQDAAVTTFTRHPNYGSGTGSYPNDIGTLHFSPLTSNSEVGTISLDNGGSLSSCVISGWGVTTVGGGSLATTLQKAAVTALTNPECIEYWGTSINDGHICVYGDGVRGACNGDSGGPMTCSSGGSLVVAGATSWGRSGCDPAWPSVYSRVSVFYDWINSN